MNVCERCQLSLVIWSMMVIISRRLHQTLLILMHNNVKIGEHLLPLVPEHETTICFDPLSAPCLLSWAAQWPVQRTACTLYLPSCWGWTLPRLLLLEASIKNSSENQHLTNTNNRNFKSFESLEKNCQGNNLCLQQLYCIYRFYIRPLAWHWRNDTASAAVPSVQLVMDKCG